MYGLFSVPGTAILLPCGTAEAGPLPFPAPGPPPARPQATNKRDKEEHGYEEGFGADSGGVAMMAARNVGIPADGDDNGDQDLAVPLRVKGMAPGQTVRG